eukprot:TRINITY_DN3792_c0_g1_i8.p1 TRINITY_DN3792_c0_g1~~TRINITY_DN3792_c0_g1_i8.p1  ORF type:complete len:413 (-),score=130.94 TRINITY_DN3792_c0_g1_i8:206-1444(-)
MLTETTSASEPEWEDVVKGSSTEYDLLRLNGHGDMVPSFERKKKKAKASKQTAPVGHPYGRMGNWMFEAIRYGRMHVFEALIRSGVMDQQMSIMERQGGNAISLVEWAARWGRVEMVQRLLEIGCGSLETAGNVACHWGHENVCLVIENLITMGKNGDWDWRAEDIEEACRWGMIELVLQMSKRGGLDLLDVVNDGELNTIELMFQCGYGEQGIQLLKSLQNADDMIGATRNLWRLYEETGWKSGESGLVLSSNEQTSDETPEQDAAVDGLVRKYHNCGWDDLYDTVKRHDRETLQRLLTTGIWYNGCVEGPENVVQVCARHGALSCLQDIETHIGNEFGHEVFAGLVTNEDVDGKNAFDFAWMNGHERCALMLLQIGGGVDLMVRDLDRLMEACVLWEMEELRKVVEGQSD